MGVPEVDKCAKYLGMPTLVGRSKKEVFCSIRDRIRHKLQGWKAKCLSKAGEEVLIKATAQSIPNYARVFLNFLVSSVKRFNNFKLNFGGVRKNKKGSCID